MRKYTDEDEETLVLSELLRYADHNPGYKRDFIDSIYDFYEKHEYITEKQLATLKGIYNLLRIKELI